MNPVIVIGAPRSGTNMLRDLLADLDGFSTWPCDEINYIWRHLNRGYPTDEFSREMARDDVKEFIRNEFMDFQKATKCEFVVEKTCANSLRVDFVDEIFPNAKYIFLVRDGRDAVGSSVRRWKAKLDLKYLLKKARYVPASDIPYYASGYLYSRLYKLVSKDKRIGIWGPKIDGIEKLLHDHSLEEVSAMQWQRCVERSEDSFKNIDQSRKLKINYESFVEFPERGMKSIAEFLKIDLSDGDVERITAGVSDRSVGKGYAQLGEDMLGKIENCVGETLREQGYL